MGAAIGLAAMACTSPPPSQAAPRLVVVIVMDMLPAGTLERIRPLLTGGLATLLADGRSFVECEHRQAATLTGPAHSTLLSGLHPRHHGIILNEWFDRTTGATVYCAEDTPVDSRSDVPGHVSTGISASNLRGQTLADALHAAHVDARVFAVSGKDRSAVLPAGHTADGAYWFDHSTGGFTGNTPAGGELPGWGRPFWVGLASDSELYRGAIPAQWDYPVRPEADEDDRPAEQPKYSRVAPHPLMEGAVSDIVTVADRIYNSPWLNELILELAGRLVEAESLGKDATPDLLILGLSAGDSVGHDYGPASQEYLDLLLRTDAWLSEFMQRTEEIVETSGPGGGVVWALSADHGVLPLPETVEGGRRIDRAGLNAKLEWALAEALGGGAGPYIAFNSYGHIYLDRQALGRAGVSVGEAATIAARAWAGFDELERVYTAEQLRGPAAESDEADLYLELYRNSYDPERSADIVIQPCHLCLITSRPWETSHGSPYDYDRRVPMILMGDGIEPGADSSVCRTVDLVPTLAGLLGLAFDTPRDGRSLLPLVDRRGEEP